VLAGALIALPWIALSWYPRKCAQQSAGDLDASETTHETSVGTVEQVGQKACILTAVTLLLFGFLQLIRLNRHAGGSKGFSSVKFPTPSAQSAQAAFLQICSVGLPIYSALKVGGFLVAFALLLTTATGVPKLVASDPRIAVQERYSRKIFTISLLGTATVLSYLGLNKTWDAWPLTGYLALVLSVFVISPPFPALRRQGPIPEPGLVAESLSKDKASSLNQSAVIVTTDAPLALVSGGFLLVLAMIASGGLPFGLADSIYILAPAGLLATALVFSSPADIRSSSKVGLAVATGSASLLSSPHIHDDFMMVYVARFILAALSFFASRMDDRHLRLDAHSHSHTHHHHNHSHGPTEAGAVTKWLLHRSEPYPLLYSILKEKDSRSIFYFMW
jgi:zinc transporter 5/7